MRSAFGQQRRPYLRALAGAALVVATTLTLPLAGRAAIDAVTTTGRVPWSAVAVVCVLGVVRGAGAAIRRYYAAILPVLVSDELRSRLYVHTQRLAVTDVERMGAGELLARASSDLIDVEQAFNPAVALSQGIALFVGGAVVMLVIDWRVAGVELAVIALAVLAAVVLTRSMLEPARRMQLARADWDRLAEEDVRGYHVISSHDLTGTRAQTALTTTERLRARAVEVGDRQAYLEGIVQAAPVLVVAVVVGLGGALGVDDRLSVGELYLFVQYPYLLLQPVQSLTNFLARWPSAVGAARRVSDVLALDVNPPEPVAPRRPPSTAGALPVRFDAVTYGYRRDAPPVLDRFELEVAAGEVVGIAGPTGAGKSTIAHLLARFDDPWSGTVEIGGVGLHEISVADARRLVTLALEDPVVFSASVADNIALGKPGGDLDEIIDAAKRAGAHSFVADLPDGYHTVVGTRGRELSGGQRQRLALARALIRESPVIVLDRVTSAVDPATAGTVVDAVLAAVSDRTAILLTDDPALLARCDRVVRLG